MKTILLSFAFIFCAEKIAAQQISVHAGPHLASVPVANRIATQLPDAPDLASALFLVEPIALGNWPNGLNNNGQAIGWSYGRLTFFSEGSIYPINGYGFQGYVGRQLNDAGKFIGSVVPGDGTGSYSSGIGRNSAVFTPASEGGGFTTQGYTDVVLKSINNQGWLLGRDVSKVSLDDFRNDTDFFGLPFVEINGSRRVLMLPKNKPFSGYLYHLNDRGEVVGGDGTSAVYFSPTGEFRKLPGYAYFDEAHESNSNGQIIGITVDPSSFDLYAALWDGANADAMTILPYGSGYPYAWPYGINKYGQIVGENGDGPVLWLNKKVINLQNKIIKLSNINIYSFRDINDKGEILSAASSAILRPVWLSLAVDANRDGAIKLASEDASDATSAAQPYRFWVNDDDDDIVDASSTGLYSEIEDDDKAIADVANEDWRNNTLDTPRDLEDFARLWVNTQGLNDSLKNGQLYLGLKWKSSTGTPAIKLHRSRDATGSADYLFNTTAASLQSLTAAIIDARYPDYVLDGKFLSDHTLIDGNDVFVIPRMEFNAPSESNSRTAFLFEGCKAGAGHLTLVILKKESTNYTEIGEGPGVWLDLKEPNHFIERWSAGNDALGEVQPVVRENSKSVSPAWGNPVTEEEKDYVLYVHGYNMQEFEKQRWIETTYKRLYWLGYKGRVGGFTWPCSQSAPPYDASEERAWESATQLKTLLGGLKAAGYHVHVMGHSQGNVVVGEALRQWKEAGNTTPLVRTYIASQAAIQAHCYDSGSPLIPGFAGSLSDDGTPNVYVNYLPAGAPYMGAVTMSGAATNWLNFENPRDYALTGNSLDPLDFHPGWQANQRLKPDVGYGWSATSGFYAQNINTGAITPLHTPLDRFRIFSYGAEGRSLALGSTTTTTGVFAGNDVDLSLAPYGYAEHHRFHSGQFRSFMSERYEYWRRLMLGIGLQPFTP